MSLKAVPCWTVICDGCGADAAHSSEYSGFGPDPSDAEETLAGDHHAKDGRHYCEDCTPPWCLECDSNIADTNPRCDPEHPWSCASCHADCDHEQGDRR